MVAAGQLQVGDQVISLNFDAIPDDFMEIHQEGQGLVLTQEQMNNAQEVIATVANIGIHESTGAVVVNTDIYSMTHWLVAKRDGVIRSIRASELLPTDLIYSYNAKDFVLIENFEKNLDVNIQVYSINIEPQDFYFTENGLTFDAYPTTWTI